MVAQSQIGNVEERGALNGGWGLSVFKCVCAMLLKASRPTSLFTQDKCWPFINGVFSQNEFKKATTAGQGQVFLSSWPFNQGTEAKAHTEFKE